MAAQRKILIPPALRPGDRIGLAAPAGCGSRKAVEAAMRYLRRRGYDPVPGRHIYQRRGYLAGSDAERAADINSFFDRDDIRAVFCTRGGYGSIRILDCLDYGTIRTHPKIFLGFSDITAMQMALWEKTRLVTYYGPMAAVDMPGKMDPFAEKHLWDMLEGRCPAGTRLAKRSVWNVLRKGAAEGRLAGGCFTLIPKLAGTPYMPDFRGKILVAEDVGEDPYRFDRSLQQLRLGGVLGKTAGVLFGKCTGCTARKQPTLTLKQVIRDLVPAMGGPAADNADFGHVDKKLTLPLGIRARLDVDGQTLTLLEDPVTAR